MIIIFYNPISGNAQAHVDPPTVVRLMCMGPGRIKELRGIIKKIRSLK